MKEVIAYMLLIFGAPIAIGGILGLLFTWLPEKVSEVIDGILSTILALLMFYYLSVKITFLVPIILLLITSLWLSRRKEYEVIIWQSIGIIITSISYFMLFN